MRSTVPLTVALAYAFPAASLALFGVTFYVLLPKYYTDVVGVSASAFGLIILFSRLWDAALDPIVGYLSDRTPSRFGRRKSWMIAGAVPLSLAFYALAAPLPMPSYPVWIGIFTFLFFFFWTAVSVPYQALGAEISEQYDERTRVLAMRDGCLVLGTLLSILIPELLSRSFDLAGRELYVTLGSLFAVLSIASIAVCAAHVPERVRTAAQTASIPFRENLRAVRGNRPFLILLGAYLISGFGSQLPATLFLYFVQYVLKSDLGPVFLLMYFAIGFLLLPFWVWYAGRKGKKRAWITAMCINAGAFVGVLFLGEGDAWWYGAIVAASGLGYGGILALPSSMQADVIDYDEYQTGKRREGQLTGLWLFANKFAGAIGAGIALPLLEWSGYRPNEVQSETVIVSLKALYAGVPCFCYGLAILLIAYYPINRERHAEIRAALSSRADST